MNRDAAALAALLTGAGVTHFAAPAFFDAMIPQALPGRPRTWTYASAVAELAVGAAVALPATRRAGGLGAAALFTGVLPGNATMAWRAREHPSRLYRLGTIARLPMQAPLIWWALRVRRAA